MKWLEGLVISILAVFAPIKTIIASMLFLVFCDQLTGMWAAHKRGESMTSAAMRRTYSKIAIYLIGVLCAYVVEVYMISNAFPLSKLIAGCVGSIELKSILENCNEIYGSNIFQTLITKLGSKNDTKDQ